VIPAKTPLGECFRRHGSDKGWPHCMDLIYHRLFPDRDAPLRILEVGLADGQSARAFAEFYPNAHYLGFDREPCARINADRIEVHQVEQTDIVGLWRAIGDRTFDLIIEDAEHVWPKQVTTLAVLWPAVRPGGFYVIEDVSVFDTGRFNSRDALAVFGGTFHNLNDSDYPDGGQLYVVRKPA
jgi:SAM-dependent methyltransferase